MNGEVCNICEDYINGSKYTLVVSDLKSTRAIIIGHDDCTADAMAKIKSYKNYQKLSVNELLKRINVTVAIEQF